MPDYEALRDAGHDEHRDGQQRLQSFAGQAEDPFFLDLRVFDLLYGGDFSEAGDDTLAGFNVNSVALQVPRRMLADEPQRRRRTRSSASGRPPTARASTAATARSPGSACRWSTRSSSRSRTRTGSTRPSPRDDGQFLDYVTKPELPKLIEAVYGIDAPEEPRNDLVSVFLTGVDGLNQPEGVTPSEQLRLNMSTPVTENPNRLGRIAGDNQGFPNGRRLADDVIDIALQVVEGELLGPGRPGGDDLSDGVDTNDEAFGDTFPYLALPARGSDDAPHDAGQMNRAGNGGSADNGARVAAVVRRRLLALGPGGLRPPRWVSGSSH